MMVGIKRGDVVLVNLDPVVGSEQGKTRPAVIIQNNFGNKYSPTTIVAPITSKVFTKEFPTNVFILKREAKLKMDSTILLNQIRTIDKSRIVKKICSLNSNIVSKIDLAVRVSLDV